MSLTLAPYERHQPADIGPVLLAGAAEVDITPPPGMPKAGYSANAFTGEGFRTRLRARVVHLRSGTASIAIVACDLLGGSSLLQHLIARQVAATTDVTLDGLWIGATHTHAGPGQFLGSEFYNRFASNKPGFDPAYTQFLVDRMAGAVERAAGERVPAVVAIGSADVYGLTRNRSLPAHVQNEEASDKRTEGQRCFAAVNPALHVLRVDRAVDAVPLAALVVFSVHGTSVPQTVRDYNADLWSYLVHEMGTRISGEAGTRPVIGAMQGTHADMAPAIRKGAAGHLESERIGRAIGEEAAALWSDLEGRLSGSCALGSALREIDLDRDRSIDGVTLPRRPAVGASLVAGATENTTPVIHRIGPFRPDHPHRRPSGDQGAKWVLGSRWLQAAVLPTGDFPRVLPLQVLRIGAVTMVGLPFEVTVESGRRVARAVTEVVSGDGVRRDAGGPEGVVVCSVVNEYIGYATTPEEYGRQFYEGGHTIYGQSTQPFLARQVRRLAADLSDAMNAKGSGVLDLATGRRFAMSVRRYLAFAGPAGADPTFAGRARFCDSGPNAAHYWEQVLRAGAPGTIAWHEPIARVEEEVSPGQWRAVADDQYGDVGVWHLGPAEAPLPADRVRGPWPAGGEHLYAVRWFDPRPGRPVPHRVVLAAAGAGSGLASEPFD